MPGSNLIAVLSEDQEPLPEWLQQPEPPFDRKNFFGHRTVYYPGWGNDGDPVRVCAKSHAAHAFIYVDYGVPMGDIHNRVHKIADDGFLGYSVEREDELAEPVLRPGGWTPHVRPFELPEDYDDWIGANEQFRLYVVLGREDDRDESHGPKRLAVLFIGGDGHATYDALYCQNDNTPAPFLVVVQDHGMGGNYSRFERGGLLEGIAAECNVYPKWLLVGSVDVNGHNYEPWDGYTDTWTAPDRQGAVGNPRRLYRREGNIKRLLLLEIYDILKDHGDDPMKMREIADLVNSRDRYRIRDRSPVNHDQVCEIWRNHQNVFERDGPRLRWIG